MERFMMKQFKSWDLANRETNMLMVFDLNFFSTIHQAICDIAATDPVILFSSE